MVTGERMPRSPWRREKQRSDNLNIPDLGKDVKTCVGPLPVGEVRIYLLFMEMLVCDPLAVPHGKRRIYYSLQRSYVG